MVATSTRGHANRQIMLAWTMPRLGLCPLLAHGVDPRIERQGSIWFRRCVRPAPACPLEQAARASSEAELVSRKEDTPPKRGKDYPGRNQDEAPAGGAINRGWAPGLLELTPRLRSQPASRSPKRYGPSRGAQTASAPPRRTPAPSSTRGLRRQSSRP